MPTVVGRLRRLPTPGLLLGGVATVAVVLVVASVLSAPTGSSHLSPLDRALTLIDGTAEARRHIALAHEQYNMLVWGTATRGAGRSHANAWSRRPRSRPPSSTVTHRARSRPWPAAPAPWPTIPATRPTTATCTPSWPASSTGSTPTPRRQNPRSWGVAAMPGALVRPLGGIAAREGITERCPFVGEGVPIAVVGVAVAGGENLERVRTLERPRVGPGVADTPVGSPRLGDADLHDPAARTSASWAGRDPWLGSIPAGCWSRCSAHSAPVTSARKLPGSASSCSSHAGQDALTESSTVPSLRSLPSGSPGASPAAGFASHGSWPATVLATPMIASAPRHH